MGLRRILKKNFYNLRFLKKKESFLEKIESCDSNRICDNFGGQYVVNYPYRISIAVDTLKDLKLVQKLIKKDKEN